MFGAVDAGLLLEVARMNGYMYQLELDLQCPPWIFVRPEYLTSESTGYDGVDSSGKTRSSSGSVDHPYFASTRDYLEREGYIKCERNQWNGDTVLKPFFFNNVYKAVGEKFSCAPAMKWGHTDKYNDGKPLPEPNYKEEPEWDWDARITD